MKLRGNSLLSYHCNVNLTYKVFLFYYSFIIQLLKNRKCIKIVIGYTVNKEKMSLY